MVKIERHEYIIKQLNLHNKVLTNELCLELEVSEDTIRRDLNELAEKKQLLKVHGGALGKPYFKNYNNDDIYALSQKQIIAKKAIKLIKNDMLILLGGGTTIRELIRFLPENLIATFCTVSLMAAEELLLHPNIDVIFIGGKLSKDSKISVGGEAIMKISEMKFDLCILGTNGIDAKNGLSDSDIEVVQVKKAMIKASRKLAVLTISEKLNSLCRANIGYTNEIDYLITELKADNEQLLIYEKEGVNLI
jgi:DeoR/GlpR family transcriptional regulator of sugar metabolism